MQLCQGGQFFLPVFYLFLRQNELTWQQIFSIEAIFTITIMLCQLPAGLLADRLGPKTVLVAGFVAGSLSLAIHTNATVFGWFAVGHALLGLFIACHAAGLEAMTYSTLAALGRSHEFRREIGKMLGWALASLGLTSIVGGLLAIVSLRLTVALTCPMFAVGALLALRLRSVPVMHRLCHQEVDKPPADRWMLVVVMLVNITLITATSALAWLSQPYQTHLGLPEWSIGLVQAASLLLAAIAAHWTHQLEQWADDRVLLLATAAIIVACFGGLAFVGGIVGIALIVVGRACFGVVATIGSDLLHQLLSDRARSRTQAIQGSLMRGVMAASCLGIGTMLDGASLSDTLAATFTVATAAMTVTIGCFSATWPGDPPTANPL